MADDGKGTDAGTDDTAEEAQERATRTADARYKPLVVRSEAAAAFIGAKAEVFDKDGEADPKKLARLLRLVNLAEVEVTDDGTITGLADQVASIKTDYPELFAGPKSPPRPKADGSDRKPESTRPKTSAAALAAQLGGG
ncbi:Terminase small subunit [Frankia sp. AiPs1]|uniref:phage scaffolding protein n=1 Tax=Frankia sp. AiPa1 TaxID=573492 RepID=UPI00202AE6EC|nr:hypothetical protein [Frankia sp. AiPa1]MCL9759022.1 hypothetical protein [Frankia sp. AiPa1]